MSWSPDDYLRFEAERTRPVRDLLSAVLHRDVARAADLGCGPGNSTEVLRERFPGAAIEGVDSSAEMLAAARTRLPDVRFTLADIASWAPEKPFDLILSNAALHWVPDHAAVLPRLVRSLAPGGVLAVQVPDNLNDPSQTSMIKVANEGSWAAKLSGAAAARTPIGSPGWHYALLRPLCSSVTIWRTTYYFPLAGAQGIVDWFSSTGLLPFLGPLGPEERQEFVAQYRRAIEETHTAMPDGSMLLAMPRLFIVATA